MRGAARGAAAAWTAPGLRRQDKGRSKGLLTAAAQADSVGEKEPPDEGDDPAVDIIIGIRGLR